MSLFSAPPCLQLTLSPLERLEPWASTTNPTKRTTSPSLSEPALVGRLRKTERSFGSRLSPPKGIPLSLASFCSWRSTSKSMLTGAPVEQKLFLASFCADCGVSGLAAPSKEQESSIGWCCLMPSKGKVQLAPALTTGALGVAGGTCF